MQGGAAAMVALIGDEIDLVLIPILDLIDSVSPTTYFSNGRNLSYRPKIAPTAGNISTGSYNCPGSFTEFFDLLYR